MLEYDVHLGSPSADDARATVKDAEVVLDTSGEQGRRTPEGPALALLRIAAGHPSIVREAAPSGA